MTNKMKNIVTLAVLVLFLGGLSLWGIVSPDGTLSESERRPLAQFPKLSVNSLLSGKTITGAVCDGTHALIAVKPTERTRTDCIACGECAEVCPVNLIPRDVLAGDGKRMVKYCIGCGACEYICPSNIPLLALINKEAKR